MEQGGYRTGRQGNVIDAEILQAEPIAQGPLYPSMHDGRKRFRIIRGLAALCRLGCNNGDRLVWMESRRRQDRRQVAKFSKRDADRLDAYAADLDAAADVPRDLVLQTPPSRVQGGWLSALPELVKAGNLGNRMRKLSLGGQRELLDLFTKSAADCLDGWFESTPIKAVYGFDSVVGNYASPYSPGSAYVLLHHVFGEVNGRKGAWGHAIGGMGAITQAMTRAAQSRGVEIRTGCAVREVLLARGRATAVVTAQGERLGARVVVSNLNPRLPYPRVRHASRRRRHRRAGAQRRPRSLARPEAPRDVERRPRMRTAMNHPALTHPALTISRILHAGYVMACGDTRIAFDTIFENPFSRNCHAFPEVRFDTEAIRGQRFDAVFISHFHDDHCSLESLDLLDRATPIHIYCLFDELFGMVRQLGFHTVIRLRLNEAVQVGPFQVTPREAMDADVDSMFQVRAAGMNVLNVVDSWIDEGTLARLVREGPWDMVLWPFQTMREIEVLTPSRTAPAPPTLPEEWIPQLQALAPRYVVPSACQFLQEPWSWYNRAFFPITYAQFTREVTAALPRAQVIRLDRSVSVTLDTASLRPAPPLDWVIPVGPQDVDYAYEGNAAPPHTSEIARHFAPLTPAELARVLDYCRVGLPDKYGDVEAASDYFDVARVWQLTLYDHEGTPIRFRYHLEGGTARTDDSDAPLGWATELPAAKLYAALAQGESLTSMYMRINDTVFDAATERDLLDVDAVDDPLIRCLFSDTFGAYQAAQLRRLLARSLP